MQTTTQISTAQASGPVAPPYFGDTDPLGSRIKALMAQARSEGVAISTKFASDLQRLADGAGEIVEIGDAVPPGVREIARRLVDVLEADAKSVQVILQRAR